MSEHPSPQEEAARRRRIAEVFGDVLPDTTTDEREPDRAAGGAPDADESARDAWYRDQVPPHHG